MRRKHRRKIGWTWSFDRMHPILKTIILLGIGIATTGYVLIGSWLLWALIKL